MFKAIIFDRDGTLNRTTDILRADQKQGDPTDGYVLSPDELVLFDAVKPALALLKQHNIAAFVFTQQNCIAKGLVTRGDIDAIHAHLDTLTDAAITAYYVAESKDNVNAKPSPKMIFDIMEKYGYAATDILVVGDSMRDYGSATAAGVPYAWVTDHTGRVTHDDMTATKCPVFADVLALARAAISGKL